MVVQQLAVAVRRGGALSSMAFLNYPSPPVRAKAFKPESCGRVLTNTENLAMIKEEERKKEEKDKEKREKQEARRAKALMKSQPGL